MTKDEKEFKAIQKFLTLKKILRKTKEKYLIQILLIVFKVQIFFQELKKKKNKKGMISENSI